MWNKFFSTFVTNIDTKFIQMEKEVASDFFLNQIFLSNPVMDYLIRKCVWQELCSMHQVFNKKIMKS